MCIVKDSFVVTKHNWIFNSEMNYHKDMQFNILLVFQYSGALLYSILLVYITVHYMLVNAS